MRERESEVSGPQCALDSQCALNTRKCGLANTHSPHFLFLFLVRTVPVDPDGRARARRGRHLHLLHEQLLAVHRLVLAPPFRIVAALPITPIEIDNGPARGGGRVRRPRVVARHDNCTLIHLVRDGRDRHLRARAGEGARGEQERQRRRSGHAARLTRRHPGWAEWAMRRVARRNQRRQTRKWRRETTARFVVSAELTQATFAGTEESEREGVPVGLALVHDSLSRRRGQGRRARAEGAPE